MRSTSSVTPLPPRYLHAVSEITLLKDEGGGLMMEHGITTITFYKGDFASSADALRAQFALVVEANSWLAGRLVKSRGGVSLRHPTSPAASDIDVIFTISPVDGAAAAAAPLMLAPTVPYTKICTDLCASKMMVGSGTSLLGKNLPITLLTLTESAAGEFSLVFSLSHAVGDGRTYYEILQMLQPGASVRSLTSTRIQSFSEAMRDVCGRAELEWADKPDTQFLYTIAMLPAMLGCGKKPECVAFYLDDDRLAAAKAAAVAEDGSVAYVSTNDVITSAFFNAVGARIGMMGMDCRGRIDGIGADDGSRHVRLPHDGAENALDEAVRHYAAAAADVLQRGVREGERQLRDGNELVLLRGLHGRSCRV